MKDDPWKYIKKLFVNLAKDEEKFKKFQDTLTDEDLVRISYSNLENGHDNEDPKDKMDFINCLPYKCKMMWLEAFEEGLDNLIIDDS